MATNTTTKTNTQSEALHQLTVLTGKVAIEMLRASRMSNVTCSFNEETIKKALTAFWLTQVITDASIVYIHNNVKLCEYRYKLVFSTGGVREYGPDVPVSRMPSGTVAKIYVYPNPDQDKEYVDAVFAQYGFGDSEPLDEADDMESTTYGAFASSDNSFGITRTRRISRRIAQLGTAKEDRW